MTKLYELTEAYIDLLSMIEDCENEQQEEEIMVQLAALSDDIARKGEAIARIVRNLQTDAEGYEAEIKRLTKRRRTAENMIDRFKSYVHFSMGLAGANELHTTIGKWKLTKNPPKVEIIDAEKVPEEFFIEQPPRLMTSLIMQHYRNTGEIPDGCDIVQTEGVRFR